MNAPIPSHAADTHTGLLRDNNEDCFAADDALGIWLVADGVGGHPCGDLASQITADTVVDRIAAGDNLVDAAIAAHHAIMAVAAERADALGMASTLVALRLNGLEYEVCWIGDSRAYSWEHQLWQVTEDHNRASEIAARNGRSSQGIDTSHQGHILTRCLGSISAAPEPGCRSGTLSPGERILLCSDGLTDELSDSLIAQILTEHVTPRAQVDALISAALDAGGRDNITAIIVEGQPAAPQSSVEPTSRRSASGGRPNDGKFPYRTLALVTAAILVAALLLS